MAYIRVFSFKPFREMIKKRGISRNRLHTQYGISSSTIDSLFNDRSITFNSVQDICEALDCNLEDIAVIIKKEISDEELYERQKSEKEVRSETDNRFSPREIRMVASEVARIIKEEEKKSGKNEKN